MNSTIYILPNSTLASALSTLLTILKKSQLLQEECNNLQSNVQAFLNQSVPILSNFTSMAYGCEEESFQQQSSYPVQWLPPMYTVEEELTVEKQVPYTEADVVILY